jgi:D-alanyl-D-alanine carboxypeptidase/D-alanyl-D-alanine-endopeptidase (penicillin-binding protein 4)
LLNYKAIVFTFTPDVAHGVATIAPDMPLAGVGFDAVAPLSAGSCDDWRSALRADFTDPARYTFGGSYPAACGERTAGD